MPVPIQPLLAKHDYRIKGTPKVPVGIPHMNFRLWGSPKPRKSLKYDTLQLRAHYFEVFREKRGPPKFMWGGDWSPERGRQIHMQGFQIQLAVGLTGTSRL